MKLVSGAAACILALSASPSVGLAFRANNVSYVVSARVSNSSRTHEVRMDGVQTPSPLSQAFRLSAEDVQVELTPRVVELDGVLFSYRVSKKLSGKWVALSAGDMLARSGQKTHLLAGDSKFGHLVNLTIRLPGSTRKDVIPGVFFPKKSPSREGISL